jgi:MoxR-like ATPase
VIPDVLRHRLVLSYDALADEVTPEDVITRVLQTVGLPQVSPQAVPAPPQQVPHQQVPHHQGPQQQVPHQQPHAPHQAGPQQPGQAPFPGNGQQQGAPAPQLDKSAGDTPAVGSQKQ